MSAEQHLHSHQSERSFRWIPDQIRKIFFTKIRQFDATPAFDKYFSDISSGVDENIAKKRMLRLLEANLRSFTQEGIGAPEINEYGFEVTAARKVPELREDSSRPVLRSLLYNDTRQEQKARLLTESNPILRERYLAEFAAWERIWNELVPSVENLLETDTATVLSNVQALGFRRRFVDANVSEIEPSDGPLSPNRLCEVTSGLLDLFPELAGKHHVEIYEHPTKFSFVSPRFSFYHQGETSIARIARLVYIPSINKFAFLESGLFTAYTNTEISQFLTLDGREDPPDFDIPKELLDIITVLSEDLAAQAPHAVFQTIIDKLGHFPQIPVGDNVEREGSRSLSTQMDFLEKIFEFEQELMTLNPSVRHRLSQRLALASEPILHSLLRNRELDVKGQIDNYRDLFSDIGLAQNPRAAQKIFRAGVLQVHPDFSTRVLSLIDCGTGTLLGGVNASLPGMEMGLSAPQLLGKIEAAERKDIESWDELVEFCKPFGIPPEWFHRNTGGEECSQCHRKDRNWMGACLMCPQCNARYNLENGDKGGITSDNQETDGSYSVIDALTGGGAYAKKTMKIGEYPAFAFNAHIFMAAK